MKHHSDPLQGFFESMTCRQVANYSHYVFFQLQAKLYFGGKEYTIQKLCDIFKESPAKSLQINVMCGPPGDQEYRRITLSQFMQDRYWLARAQRNDFVLDKFRHAIKGSGVAV